MFYRPEAFEPLVDDAWDETRVRDGIAEIVADADSAYDSDALWPANEWDAWESTPPLKDLYCGAGGVAWGLDALRRRGHPESRIDLGAATVRALELAREAPDLATMPGLPVPHEPSLLCGEGGLLLLAWRLAPSAELADGLLERVQENVANEMEELMWGSPGTMLAAQIMHGWTGEQRWVDAWRESADGLHSRRGEDGFWTQRLYGAPPSRILGPVHGFVGIVHALLQGDDERNEALRHESAALLEREALVDGELATWPPVVGGELANKEGQIRVQWCHGSPGIVTTARDYLDEELLRAGAELTWRAGPHGPEKGPSLCHGTAGNGYAFLAAFARTGDEEWLDRARRFAVHALAQVERSRGEDGRGRYSLFTGDVGVALYAAACLDADPRFPVLEGWDEL